MKKTKTRKLSLNRQTIRQLRGDEAQQAAGGGLSFNMCGTDNCMTLGEFCATHDCMLTFRPGCGLTLVLCIPGAAKR